MSPKNSSCRNKGKTPKSNNGKNKLLRSSQRSSMSTSNLSAAQGQTAVSSLSQNNSAKYDGRKSNKSNRAIQSNSNQHYYN